MKNKVEFKKTIVKTSIVSVIMVLILVIINIFEYRSFIQNYNSKIISIASGLRDKYPELTDNDIITIINSNGQGEDIFRQYGFNIKEESIIQKNKDIFIKFIICEIVIIIIFMGLMEIVYLKYNKKKDKDIKEITELINRINHRNYELDISENTEDGLSALKNEIYKTTIMLREETDNSIKDKLELKKSLEDISHQLKTPLTSILINLDNLMYNPNLEQEKREEFLREIKNKTYNIKFLIEALLKLSKFDVNTIEFNEDEVLIKELIGLSLKNVLALADLKNVKISFDGNNADKVTCDFKWQVEAISNILKNAIEHSKENSEILIAYETNNVYSKITVKDFGDGISNIDLKHIFERFYKGKNSSNDSIGIGLALAKTIIEKDNGRIDVKSDKNGTTFVIKYFKQFYS